MDKHSMRFRVRWFVVAAILLGVIAVVVAFDRRERLRREIAIERAGIDYRNAKLARELAEADAKAYAEWTFPRELATIETSIRQAEEELNRTAPARDWGEEIRAKGWLLLMPPAHSKKLAEQKAAFAIEQAKSQRKVLEDYTKAKILEELNNRVAKASTIELAKKAVYDKIRATPAGLFGRVMGHHWPVRP